MGVDSRTKRFTVRVPVHSRWADRDRLWWPRRADVCTDGVVPRTGPPSLVRSGRVGQGPGQPGRNPTVVLRAATWRPTKVLITFRLSRAPVGLIETPQTPKVATRLFTKDTSCKECFMPDNRSNSPEFRLLHQQEPLGNQKEIFAK